MANNSRMEIHNYRISCKCFFYVYVVFWRGILEFPHQGHAYWFSVQTRSKAINADGISLVAFSDFATFILLFYVVIGQCRFTQIYHLMCVYEIFPFQ